MIKNRIEKNYKKLKAWAERAQIQAYRLYDRDIPEYPFIVDRYADKFLIYDKSDLRDKDKNHLPHVIDALKNLFSCSEEAILIKKRERQEGTKQYEKLDSQKNRLIVRESQAQLYVNLTDYLDTGLFLDHRPMRQKIHKMAAGKKLLNLFCYTGSVSVFAALAGARTTSVDMSQTYLKWAQDNFELNQIDFGDHSFINANVLEWLQENRFSKKFDMIFLDPPTFSNSKKMESTFDVERDQNFLVNACMQMLTPGGVLFFSNNKRSFKLSPEILNTYAVRDLTKESIPQDFHDSKIHCCFEIRQVTKEIS